MEQVFSDKAPAAIGPYVHAVKHGDMIFCSGQIALNPETMELDGNTIEEQTLRVMINLEAVLESVGIDLGNIIKTTIFLKDMNDFADMNQVYEKALGGHRPARSTIEVSRLPKDALVEIECIASLN